MKRKLFALMMILCLLTMQVLIVHAANVYLVDDANLLTTTEAASLEKELEEISNRQGVDVVVVTMNSTNGQDVMDVADDYYDYGGYRDDGILLLISMEERDWWISTAGYGITAVTDARLEYMADSFLPYLSDGEYAQAFREYARLCDEFITTAKNGEPFAFGRNLIIALVIGLIVALIATGVMKAKLKSVHQQAKADDYMVSGSFKLTHSRDLFLYTHLERRERPKSSSGSSTHTSSSGRTHGGGGGKF